MAERCCQDAVLASQAALWPRCPAQRHPLAQPHTGPPVMRSTTAPPSSSTAPRTTRMPRVLARLPGRRAHACRQEDRQRTGHAVSAPSSQAADSHACTLSQDAKSITHGAQGQPRPAGVPPHLPLELTEPQSAENGPTIAASSRRHPCRVWDQQGRAVWARQRQAVPSRRKLPPRGRNLRCSVGTRRSAHEGVAVLRLRGRGQGGGSRNPRDQGKCH